MTKVAVENSLSSIKQVLQNNGYEVVNLEDGGAAQSNDVQCCIISGLDKNVMGMADVTTQASIINADGMTDEQVLQQVQQTVSSA